MRNKIISVFLAVVMAFSFCASCVTISVSAAGLSVFLSYIGLGITQGLFAGLAGTDIVNALSDIGKDDDFNSMLVDSTFTMSIDDNQVVWSYVYDDNLSEFENNINFGVCDYLNNNFDWRDSSSNIRFDPTDMTFKLNASVYSDIKENVLNSLVNSTANELNKYVSEYIDMIPSVEFDILENFFGVSFPGRTTPKAADLEGYYFYPTIKFDHYMIGSNIGKGYFFSETAAYAAGAYESGDSFQRYNGEILYYATFLIEGIQSYQRHGYYCLYNNDVFYLNSAPAINTNSNGILIQLDCYNPTRYINSDGIPLSNFYSANDTHLLPNGIYYTKSPDVPRVPITQIDQDEFYNKIAGDIYNYEVSNGDKALSDAVGLGIISADPDIVLNSQGEIVSADGISIGTLAQLIETMSSEQIRFEDIESYLQYISACLAKSNVAEGQINNILNNIRSYEQLNNDALNEINEALGGLAGLNTMPGDLANIKSNVQTIADSLTEAKEAEYEQMNRDFNMYVVEHHGLSEANSIVQNLTIVQQLQVLFDILCDPDTYTPQGQASAPSFRFYWDSNKDGTREVYNALDLSFLEQRLTNSNLEDKTRFSNAPTIRELIQGLIIMVCYILFAIKVIKNLSGIITGSLSGGSAVSTVIEKSK